MGRVESGSEQAAAPYATVCETHTGLVVLAGNSAYKVKKPVRTEFLDFSTQERREEACQRELELNRRLAPESYLGVAHLDSPWIGASEPVLVMRRLDESRRLSTIVRRCQSAEPSLSSIARILAVFHAGAERGSRIDQQGTLDAVKHRWDANIAEMRQFTGTVIDEKLLAAVQSMARNFMAGREPLFNRRIHDRRIIDGHGDLLADDIFCLATGPQILDCLEFDDELRFIDSIDDVAFLAMDLEFLGRKDLGEFFLDHYTRLAADRVPQSLLDFYIAYRALVRAKVDGMRYQQGMTDSATDAGRHMEIALAHLRAGRVRLALVGGGPGTGKSTLARALADRVDAVVVSTDQVRRDMLSSRAIRGEPGVLNAGLYSERNVAAVYDEALQQARSLLADGRSVIVDASWRDARHRAHARHIADQTYSTTIELACDTDAATAARRVATRPADGMSDATPEIAVALAELGQQWPEAQRIDTGCAVAASVCAVGLTPTVEAAASRVVDLIVRELSRSGYHTPSRSGSARSNRTGRQPTAERTSRTARSARAPW